MLTVNEKLYKGMTCQNCGKDLEGMAPSVSPNGQQNITVPLCPDCLEKAAWLIRGKQHTCPVVYIITRIETSALNTSVINSVYHSEEEAYLNFRELYREDMDVPCPPDTERYTVEKNNKDFIHAEIHPQYIR